jgi:hypothetical protein
VNGLTANPTFGTNFSVGRIPVMNVSPTAEEGRWPAKAVVGEAVPIRATVFREGHDAVGATAVLVGPDGTDGGHPSRPGPVRGAAGADRRGPMLRQLRNLTVHPTSNDAIICSSKHLDAEHSPTGREDTVVVVLTIDPFRAREAVIDLDTKALGLRPAGAAGEVTFAAHAFAAHDVLSGETSAWGDRPFVRLDPPVQCAHLIHVRTS